MTTWFLSICDKCGLEARSKRTRAPDDWWLAKPAWAEVRLATAGEEMPSCLLCENCAASLLVQGGLD